MPIIKCPKCGSTFSVKATACPKCGYAVMTFSPNNNGEVKKLSQRERPVQKEVPLSHSVKNKKNNTTSSIKSVSDHTNKDKFDWTIILLIVLGIAAIVGAFAFSNWLQVTFPVLFAVLIGIKVLNDIFDWF